MNDVKCFLMKKAPSLAFALRGLNSNVIKQPAPTIIYRMYRGERSILYDSTEIQSTKSRKLY